MVLFYGAMPKEIARHHHPVIQLIIGTEKPFLKKAPDGSWQSCRSLLVAPNVTHECDAAEQKIFSLSIDPESELGAFLIQNDLADRDQLQFTETALDYFDFERVEELIRSEAYHELYHYCLAFFQPDGVPPVHAEKEERIETVKHYIKEHLDQRITSSTLCELVFLSESRLLHLFKQEMGLPIRNYILWVRLTKALEMILAGESLTRAAHDAGFFDSSHMSRTFVRQLGINPAEIVKNSKFIQVSVLEQA